MRLRRSSRQTALSNSRRANKASFNTGEPTASGQATAADNGYSVSTRRPDHSWNNHEQTYKHPSSELTLLDQQTLARRKHRASIGQATGYAEQVPATTNQHQYKPAEGSPLVPGGATGSHSTTNQHTGYRTDMHSMFQQDASPPPDSQLWVRIPFPLPPYVQLPPAPAQGTAQLPDTGLENKPSSLDPKTKLNYQYIAPPGWFNLHAMQMREMTVTKLDEASNAMWDGSRSHYVPQPDDPP